MDRFDEAADWVRSSREVVVFTGAGISAESGIPTFRDDSGLWQRFPPEQFATWAGLVRTATLQPRRFCEFVYSVLEPIAAARPNPAHRAIAEAERHTGITVVTQNIDGLHQAAGSTTVHEIHGSLLEIVTVSGRFRRLLSRADLREITSSLEKAFRGILTLPRALVALRRLIGIGSGGAYRPNLVLFGDALVQSAWTQSVSAARTCDCFLQVGCSGLVLPAATLPQEAKAAGACILAVDPNPTEADFWLQGRAAEVVPMLFETAFGKGQVDSGGDDR